MCQVTAPCIEDAFKMGCNLRTPFLEQIFLKTLTNNCSDGNIVYTKSEQMFNTKEDIMFLRDILTKKRCLILKIIILAIFASIIAVFCFHINKSSGVSTGCVDKKLSYVSVTINHDDSLWSIAKRYKNQYDGSFNDFIAEIKRCNGLESDTIYAGNNIIIPVVIYSERISSASKISK